MQDDFFLTNLELRESTDTGEVKEGLSHRSMEGMFLLQVLELAARGEPRGAITFVHDLGDHGGRYRHLAEHLAESGWAVALPDLRGHGGSEGERGHSAGVNEVVRDLQEIQDHLAYRMPDAPKVLIGLGLGALYATAFALERPGVVTALILLNPLVEPRFEPPSSPGGLKKFFQKLGPRSVGRTGWSAENLSSDRAAIAAREQDPLVHDAVTLRAIEVAADAARVLPRLSGAGVPTLVISGNEDSLAPVDRVRAAIGESVTVREVSGRHDLLHDVGADAALTAIAEFLAELTS